MNDTEKNAQPSTEKQSSEDELEIFKNKFMSDRNIYIENVVMTTVVLIFSLLMWFFVWYVDIPWVWKTFRILGIIGSVGTIYGIISFFRYGPHFPSRENAAYFPNFQLKDANKRLATLRWINKTLDLSDRDAQCRCLLDIIKVYDLDEKAQVRGSESEILKRINEILDFSNREFQIWDLCNFIMDYEVEEPELIIIRDLAQKKIDFLNRQEASFWKCLRQWCKKNW